jgi:hypothetical protein
VQSAAICSKFPFWLHDLPARHLRRSILPAKFQHSRDAIDRLVRNQHYKMGIWLSYDYRRRNAERRL